MEENPYKAPESESSSEKRSPWFVRYVDYAMAGGFLLIALVAGLLDVRMRMMRGHGIDGFGRIIFSSLIVATIFLFAGWWSKRR